MRAVPTSLIFTLLAVQAALAQSPVGTRAEGMAGAYVAVADDASAVYWNPAGIVTAPFVSVVVGGGGQEKLAEGAQTTGTEQLTHGLVAFSATAVGAAYYRLTSYGFVASEPEVSGSESREEVGRTVHALSTSTLGVSLLHSLTDHLVVGATPKYVRGAGANAFDVDAGAMFSANHLRLGLVARNLTAPSFEREDGVTIELDRQVRVGAAWGSGWTGTSRVIVSLDGDVTSRVAPDGDRRDVAAGVETWWLQQRLGVRAGARGSTMNGARAAYAAGLSAGLTSGFLFEAHVVRGHADERSWSVGARMLF